MASQKQPSITSFFARPKNLLTQTSKVSWKHDDIDEPATKRRRISNSPQEPLHEAQNDADSSTQLRLISGNNQGPKTTPRKATVSARTSKYLFDSSPQQENLPDEPHEIAKKAELHRKFVRRLGRPDSIQEIKRRNRALFDEEEEGTPEGDDEDEDAVSESKGRAPTKSTTKKAKIKLTPMEIQVIGIKKAHMDTLLVVEVGYKFRFFGEDARVAAKELGIVCIPGKFRFDEHPSEAHLDRFASASIPVHRLHVHVKRLVMAGHKVGVVRQLETAALKAAGDNRNAPFVRKMTNLYTKGTYVDDVEGLEEDMASPSQTPSTGFLLCMTEDNVKGSKNDETVNVGIVAVQPATGDVIYDNFEDGFMRTELESRLLHIAPCEFLIVGDLSRTTEKVVMHLAGSKANIFGDKARIERVTKQKTVAAQSHSHVSSFYVSKLQKQRHDDGKSAKLLDKILGLPEHVIICLSALIKHTSEYGLEHVFDLTKYFQAFSARSHMLINGNTLNSLEIYQNQTDHSVRGSLLWTLDRTHTKFGSRQLRKWVGRPLLDQVRIEERLTAVEELLDSDNATTVDAMRRIFSRIKIDLEKSLLRIYYGKCSRSELLIVLQSFQFLANEFASLATKASAGFKSELITSVIKVLPTIQEDVTCYLDKINLVAAKANDKYTFFREEHETEVISDHKFGIASIENDLDSFRTTAAEKLGQKKPVEYNTVAGIDYLIEVDNASSSIKKVPASWTKVSGTKKVSRFHPPEIVRLLRERDQHKESLAAACDAAFQDLLSDISTKYQLLRDAILALASLDCLLSLAAIANQPGYVRPTFVAQTGINITGARHPMIEQLLLDAYVPNDVSLSHEATRALLVTGPNMGGKSSYVRSVALITIMAQIGCFVPADSAVLGVVDAVFTRMGAFDNMMAGESTFMVELSETSDILRLSTERSLVVLDELGRGTSTHDGVAIAGSVLDWLVREKKCMTLFITHYQVLARMADGFENNELKNVHMKFSEVAGSEDNITFLYEVSEGVAHRSYGLNVARLAGLSDSVIRLARDKSAQLEDQMRERQLTSTVRVLLEDPKNLAVDDIVEALESM